MAAISRHWPLTTAIIILWITMSALLVVSMKQNQGHLVYALDDPDIHMAMAKNFAQHGVWGISRYEFSSSSSSLLWTLLLSAIYFILGANESSPFILNVIFATAIIFLYMVPGAGQTWCSLFLQRQRQSWTGTHQRI